MSALALRFAWRELRGGLRGFGVFVACIVLGVMAIAGVGSVAKSLSDGLSSAGRVILGGDLAFSLVQREASGDEQAFLGAHGVVSVAATLPTMARTDDGRAALVEIKAVDGAYPLFGAVATNPAMPLPALFARQGDAFGAAVDPALLSRLDLKPGDRIAIGDAAIELRAVLTGEPDKLAGGIGFGPRVLISEAALRASGLLQPGSIVRWQYRLRLPDRDASDGAVASVEKAARSAHPNAGWDIRTRSKASPQLERNVERFSQYLTLVALTALLVGGVGVANAVASHLARKRDSIATMKALGATGAGVFAVYCTQIVLVAFFATLLGAVLGAALPFVIAAAFGSLIPLPVAPSLYPSTLVLSIAYGLLTALAFALWPLGRAHDISVSMLFRDQIAAERRWPRRRYVIATVSIIAALAAMAVLFSLRPSPCGDLPGLRRAHFRRATPRRHADDGGCAPAAAPAFDAAPPRHRQYPPAGSADAERRALARPRSLPAGHPDRNRRQPASPVHRRAAGKGPFVLLPGHPIGRCRTLRWRGARTGAALHPGARAHAARPHRRRERHQGGRPQARRGIGLGAARRPRYHLRDRNPGRIACRRRRLVGRRLCGGAARFARKQNRRRSQPQDRRHHHRQRARPQHYGADRQPARRRLAKARHQFRAGVLAGAFAGAPHSDIATLTFADGDTPAQETALVKALAKTFPAVSAVRVKDALETVDRLIGNLLLGLRSASAVTLIAAALVLGGALAASQRFRIYDAVVLKTLGATRGRLIAAYALEYLLIGLATVLFGVAAGSLAAALVVTRVMEVPFVFVPAQAAGAAGAALLVTVVLGLLGTFTALDRKPAEVLRNL